METNFFQQLSAIQSTGEWTIVISQSKPELMTVSVLYSDPKCGDDAAKVIPPLTFSQAPHLVDNVFFKDISSAIGGTVQLLSSMEHYLKERENARSQSHMNKDQQGKTKEASKESKYDAALRMAAELECQGKYRDAWMKVPEPSDHPEQADFLRKRREELSAHFAPNLFNS